MNPAEYDRMRALEERCWWFLGRQAIVEGVLSHSTPFARQSLDVLDVGCGTGKILTDLTARGHRVVGLDFSDRALTYCAGRGAEMLVRGDAQRLPFADRSFDLIVALDILEHVPDDDAMASEILRVLRPGGHAILNVPAHPMLWSEHDVALHHFRRYTPHTLRTVLEGAGLRLDRMTWSICSLYPVAAAVRALSRLFGTHKGAPARSHMVEFPGIINALLTAVLRLESKIIPRCNMPWGLSLLVLASKPLDR